MGLIGHNSKLWSTEKLLADISKKENDKNIKYFLGTWT